MQDGSGERSTSQRWLVRFPRATPIAIFLLIAAITVVSVFAIERGEESRAAAQLRGRATAIASALERRANLSSAYLRAGAALLATLDNVNLERFRLFATELRLDADYRGVEGIGWAQVVRPGEVDEFHALMDSTAPVPARLRPTPDPRQRYSVPVTFLHPDTERNRLALGFDMYSEPNRRAAMDEAALTSRPAATDRVVLAQEGGDQSPGFLIYMPVFEGNPRDRQLRGYIYSPLNGQDFLDSALELEEAGTFAVRLFDGEPAEDRLLATSGAGASDAGRRVRETVSIGNNAWVLELESAEAGGLSGLSMATIIFGLLVASLLMLLVRMLTQQAVEDEASLRWFQEQDSIRMSLTRELNHRVKNTLANVLSIIALTRRRAAELNEFADGLNGRIRALSATHDLLTKSEWGTTPIRAVVEAELLPYGHASDHTLDIRGPEIELAPNDALSLGLATHELATNAAKYGALKQPGGRVSVHWRMVSDSLVQIEWQESGGPPVPQDRRRGFGTDLIERIVAAELKSPVKLEFNPAGVRCVLTIPVRQPSQFALRAAKGPVGPLEFKSAPRSVRRVMMR